jgi:hypothetical protein
VTAFGKQHPGGMDKTIFERVRLNIFEIVKKKQTMLVHGFKRHRQPNPFGGFNRLLVCFCFAISYIRHTLKNNCIQEAVF